MYSDREIIRIAKKYYELGMTQKEIAEEENLSRPTISRILDTAHKRGFIKITINYPLKSVNDLENEFLKEFNLRKVFITPVYVNDESIIKNDVGKALSKYIKSICRHGDIIGISWGTTLAHLVENLGKIERKDVKIVQLNGSVGRTSFSTGAMTVLEKFSNTFSAAESYVLSVPAIVDHEEIAKALMQDSQIQEILSLGRESNIAVFGIGRASEDSILYKAGYFTSEQYRDLLGQGAVGDICSRYFTINGELCNPELNKRTIGIQLEELKAKEHAIGMACGEEKAPAILGALLGRYINTLFTDELTAKKVLDLSRNRGNLTR